MTLDLPTLLAALALLLALVALTAALVALRKADDAQGRAHTHKRPSGPPSTPQVERRDRDLGPPRGVPERRGAHADPDEQRARRRDTDDPRWTTRSSSPRPETTPATAEHAPPTRDLRLPPPGMIGR